MGYRRRVMKRASWAIGCGVIAALLAAGCAKQPTPLGEPPPSTGAFAPPDVSIPLDVQEFEVVQADGFRGVFIKLSRLPDAVEHKSQSDPARILLEIRGPTGDETPEESFPGEDMLVTRVRVSRSFGVLRVALDLSLNDPPQYTVHTMTDWIMIRLGPTVSTMPRG